LPSYIFLVYLSVYLTLKKTIKIIYKKIKKILFFFVVSQIMIIFAASKFGV